MKLWADADSLPKAVRDIIERRAEKSGGAFDAVFVSNKKLPEKRASCVVCENADDYIIAHALEGDLVITRDIPLAARALRNGLAALNDRGAVWDEGTVRERLSVRNYMTELRELGLAEAPSARKTFGSKEIKLFADALDKALRRGMK